MSEKKLITMIKKTVTMTGKELKEHVAEVPDDKMVEVRTVVNVQTSMPELHIIIPMSRDS